VTLAELSASLGVEGKVIMKDLTQVTARAFYQPPGRHDLLLEVTGDRVTLWNPGAFHRPVRLSMLEAVCLGLAFRGRLAGRFDADAGTEARERTYRLLHALEATLSAASTEQALACIEAADLRPDPAGIRELLSLALEGRNVCRIRYLKPGDGAPEERTVRPYGLVHAEGHWYLLAHCEASGDIRRFRVDRVLEAEIEDRSFQAPEGFRPEDHLEGSRVFHASAPVEVTVRYSPAVARWIVEREEGRAAPDGAVEARYPVADPNWIVRHVLQYGPDAEILEPDEARGWIRGVVEKVRSRDP
jgi:predicted DNA-binding transcriptional regulator YafY